MLKWAFNRASRQCVDSDIVEEVTMLVVADRDISG
jgi:hypothetical protein